MDQSYNMMLVNILACTCISFETTGQMVMVAIRPLQDE